MTKRTVANNFLYYIFCGFSGAVTSLIVWLFLKLMGLGIGLVWDTIPSNFDFQILSDYRLYGGRNYSRNMAKADKCRSR